MDHGLVASLHLVAMRRVERVPYLFPHPPLRFLAAYHVARFHLWPSVVVVPVGGGSVLDGQTDGLTVVKMIKYEIVAQMYFLMLIHSMAAKCSSCSFPGMHFL